MLVHEPHAGLGRLETGALTGARLDACRPDLGQPLPTGLDGVDALVVLGGSMAAWQDDVAPWLPATRRLLAEAVERSIPTLGVCLGAQLLALATGGRVDRGDGGLEVGLVDIELTAAAPRDRLLGPVAERFTSPLSVPHWHQDAVTRLPDEAVLLATAARYPHQAYRLGDAAWGLQYHPEVSAADWRDWVAGGHGALNTAGLDADQLVRSFQQQERYLVALALAHAEAFAAVLGLPDTSGRGVDDGISLP